MSEELVGRTIVALIGINKMEHYCLRNQRLWQGAEKVCERETKMVRNSNTVLPCCHQGPMSRRRVG